MSRTKVHCIGMAALIALLTLSAGCAPPGAFVEAPTAIPTLAPATLPASPEAEQAEEGGEAPASPPESFPSAARGRAVYEAQCAACHGQDGVPSISGPPDFTDPEHMRDESPAHFFQTVSNGTDKGMPGFKDRLSEQERWDVVFYVRSLSLDEAVLASGQDIYNASCASCHAEDGSGAIDTAPDFTAVELAVATVPQEFFKVVTEGEGAMPGWQSVLSEEERWAAVSYLLTFGYEPAGE